MLTSRNTRVLLFGVILVAIFFRFFAFRSFPPGLYPDEAMNGNNALEAIKTGHFKIFYPENNGREGLFINIQALFLKLTGVHEAWALHIPSAIFGTLTVLGVFFLGRKLFLNNAAGLISAFFLATNFWHLNFSRIGFRAISAPFFLVWGFYFFLKGIDAEDNKRLLWLILGGAVYGLGFHTYIAYRATPLFIFLVAWIYRERIGTKEMVRRGAIFGGIAFLIVLPLGIYFLAHPADFLGRTNQISIFSSSSPIKDLGLNIIKTLGMFNVIGDGNQRHNISGAPELSLPVGILFLVGLFFGLWYFFRKNHEGGTTLILWSIVAAIPVVVSNEGIPHALRSILIAPAACMLAGYGALLVYEKVITQRQNAEKITLVCAVLLSIFLIGEAYHNYFILWGKSADTAGAFSKNYVDIGHELNALPSSLPKYVIVEAGGVDVRGYPMPTQTIMFLTNTFLREEQQAKNIHYIFPNQKNEIPEGSFVATIN